jgi:mitochondrial fission protein ELM1
MIASMLHDLTRKRMEVAFAQSPPKVWLLMGHKAGDNSQVLALGEALGWSFEIKRFVYKRTELLSNLLLGPTLAGVVLDQSSALEAPWPDLIITAGRRNEPIARWIQKQAAAEKHVRIVHCGRSWAKIERFDLIVTTPQYRLPQRPNILHNRTPLHRVTQERLRAAADQWRPRLRHLPGPYLAVVIGGDSGPFTFDRAAAERLARQASRRAKELGASLLVTTSARTPRDKITSFERALEVPAEIFRWSKDATENPYFGYLALADEIVVTGDSMSMLTEACATRKPVHIFDLGVGRAAMRPEQPAAPAPAGARGRKVFEPAHLRAFIYRLGMHVGPQRMTRDIRIVHRVLVDSGMAVWLGDPFPAASPPGVESVDRAVAEVRRLFELPDVRGVASEPASEPASRAARAEPLRAAS